MSERKSGGSRSSIEVVRCTVDGVACESWMRGTERARNRFALYLPARARGLHSRALRLSEIENSIVTLLRKLQSPQPNHQTFQLLP